MSALAEYKIYENFSGIPLLELQVLISVVVQDFHDIIMWLCLVMCWGLGQTACRFLGRASLLEYAGREEKTAGERRERADGGAVSPDHFTSEHQPRSTGLTGPDEQSQQTGVHCLLTEILPAFFPFLTHADFKGSDTKTDLINFALLSSSRWAPWGNLGSSQCPLRYTWTQD